MGTRMKAQVVSDAQAMAVWQRKPEAWLLVHSDRGCQYASLQFRHLLNTNGFVVSMARKGDCCDNAVVESFFGTLKQELVQWKHYQIRIYCDISP